MKQRKKYMNYPKNSVDSKIFILHEKKHVFTHDAGIPCKNETF